MATTYPTFGIKIAANNNEHARHHVGMGVDIGSTDLTLSKRIKNITHFLYLELKTMDGELSPSQIKWNEDFDDNFKSSNCIRDVAYGFNEAKRIINDWITNLDS